MSTGLPGEPTPEGPVEPPWESLKRCPIPEWVRDAKFGVYTHWGVYSVPAYRTNTYCADMYARKPGLSKHDVRAHHEKACRTDTLLAGAISTITLMAVLPEESVT